jgi:hypothetical protein
MALDESESHFAEQFSGEFDLGDKSIFPKSKLIDLIDSLINSGNEVDVRTIDGTKVYVIDNRYFRTDGDTNDQNDLLDLPTC